MVQRRKFLRVGAGGVLLLGITGGRTTITRAHSRPGSANRDLESLVAVLVETPREALLERLVSRIRGGLGYQPLLEAAAVAAARQVAPYPVVGYKYHALMVLQAVHLCTVKGRAADRWLPVLWAADTFKGAQARNLSEGGWHMSPVIEARVPAGERSAAALRDALEAWDVEGADAAIVGLARAHPPQRVFDLLFHYGARDFRHIGHKAITAANCHRLLEVLGWRAAEPLLRSLTYALVNHQGEPNPAHHDLVPDRPWRHNLVLARELPRRWGAGESDDEAIPELMALLREGDDLQAAEAFAARLAGGLSPATLWQAIHAAAGELMLRRSGIIAVHANTTANALHYAYRHTTSDLTRRLLLLQAGAFMPLFRERLGDDQRPLRLDQLTPLEPDAAPGDALTAIFREISHDRVAAARRVLGYLEGGGSEAALMELARHHTVVRNTGTHDYKFVEAAFENAAFLGPPWRRRYVAASTLYYNGSADADNPVVAAARSLLAQA
ncbi:MAG: hypothetical protein U5S82_14535 [Gammaproteobacteria bacterium]|nr:hypothetical protein [Gammaproteobacteria bacterium]